MKRTDKQNAALHLWLRRVAEYLCDQGIDMRTFVRVPVRPNERLVKELIWRPTQQAIFGDEKTSHLSTGQVDIVYEALYRALTDKFDTVPPTWPSEAEMMALGNRRTNV